MHDIHLPSLASPGDAATGEYLGIRLKVDVRISARVSKRATSCVERCINSLNPAVVLAHKSANWRLRYNPALVARRPAQSQMIVHRPLIATGSLRNKALPLTGRIMKPIITF
jgi:hypothetical protein